MRKLNLVLVCLMIVPFLLHGVFGAMQLTFHGTTSLKVCAWVCFGLMIVHTCLSAFLTVDALRNKTRYPKETKVFWARRISGIAVLILVVWHISALSYCREGIYTLKYFGIGKLIGHILLVLALAFHLLSNLRPLLIGFGAEKLYDEHLTDMIIIGAVVMSVFAAAFVVYYLAWRVM